MDGNDGTASASRGVRLDRELAASLASQYPNMGSLDLQHNGISFLEDLRPLSGLTELRLDHNDLRSLEHLHGLSQVTKLSARSNAISRLGEDVASLTALEVLDLADNRLEAGPWVSFLARLPALRDLDVRGNPVCALAGSQELLKAALPGLAVLNGRHVAQEQEPLAVPSQPQQQQGQQYRQQPHADLGAGSQMRASGQGYGDARRLSPGSPEGEISAGVAPAESREGAGSWDTNAYLWTDAGRDMQDAQQWDNAAEQTDGPSGLIEISSPVQLAAEYAVLLGENERLSQRAASLEASLQAAEDAQLELQERLHEQVSRFVQQAASVAGQISSLVAERDAAVRHADALAAQLVDTQAAAAAAANDAAQLRQVASEAVERERALQQELAATQELLLSQAHQAAVAARSAIDAQAAAAPVRHEAAAGPGRSVSPTRAQANEAALQALRISSLQQIVQMQERELVRLGMGAEQVPPPPTGSPPSVGMSASPSRSPTARWENLLRPWREQVQALHEQNARQASEVAEQRQEWAQQLGEMQEQFMSTRTLIEVLEQRLREQRAEKQQLGLQVRQRAAELESAHQHAAQLEQQLASREAAAQAVRRQLLAFQAASEQQASALEARAKELDAHASRLSFACQRLVFVLSLHAVRSRGPLTGVPASDATARLSQAGAAMSSALGCGGVSSSGSGTSTSCNRSLVEVLQQEVVKMGRDRDVLLKQLAQVSALAEDRIRQAQEAMQERETRHREALVATRVQVQVGAMQASLASQVAQMRQQVATAVYAAEEMARSAEAAAGVRLSRLAVRLQEIAKQVTHLRSVKQRGAAAAEAAAAERQHLRQQLAQAESDAAELRRQLAGADAEAHTKVAELNAAHEAALAAERRRTTEAERLASKAAAECGHMERDLARAREAKAQQDDMRTRRLQTQLQDQELQLRSLRRERNSLLSMLKTHGITISDTGIAAASDTSQVPDTQKPWPADAGHVDAVSGSPSQSQRQHERRDGMQPGLGGGTGGLISSILRGTFDARKGAGSGRAPADPAHQRLERLEAMTHELLD